MRSLILPLAFVLFLAVTSLGIAQAPKPEPLVRDLAEFSAGSPPNQASLEKAIAVLRKTGGVLVVPKNVWDQLKTPALQGLTRTPAPPAETKQWQEGAGVTVISSNDRQVKIHVPPLDGLHIERTFRLDDRDSAPHWGTHPAVSIDSKLVYGSSSYLDWLHEPVAKGKDRRFYMPTIRGIRPGQFLNLHGGPGYGGGVTRGVVKDLGYDPQKRMPFFVADTDIDHVIGSILHNKSNTGVLHMTQTSNADNQTYDVKIIRKQYAHGDTYMYYCDFDYMSNVHSAAGDENGNCYAAFIRTMADNFQGTVEAIDWSKQQLKFGPSSQNVQTLGDSRPMINRNPKKAITQGKVLIVPPTCYIEPIDDGQCKFEGRSYPTRLIKNPKTGVQELKMGGLIRGDKDCPWTEEIIGRYFAVTTQGEKTEHGDLRWYQITDFRKNADGTKDIEIRRYWWGAKSAASPTLYARDNYTWDGHLRPLEYTISPGTYVNDVARAIPGGDRGGQRIVGLAPYRDQGSPSDFEAGDPIEQAIGPDPFKPQAFRVWMWEDVPGPFPAAVLDFANYGAASRYSAMTIAGGPATMGEVAKRQEQKPAWDNVIVLNSAVGVGLNCKADFGEAAILFNQPNREQPIKWHYAHQEGSQPKTASLTVSKTSGELVFEGGGIRTNGPASGVQGLSGDDKAAKNLRGKNLAVGAKAKSLRVKFPRPESDGDYAVFVEQSWITQRAISDKTADGFTVSFETAAPEKATLDWMLVR